MRLAASRFALVSRFNDDRGVMVGVAEPEAEAEAEASVPRLGALLDRIPVDVLSRSWVFGEGRELGSSCIVTRVQARVQDGRRTRRMIHYIQRMNRHHLWAI